MIHMKAGFWRTFSLRRKKKLGEQKDKRWLHAVGNSHRRLFAAKQEANNIEKNGDA